MRPDVAVGGDPALVWQERRADAAPVVWSRSPAGGSTKAEANASNVKGKSG
jgi:hypothetical protein